VSDTPGWLDREQFIASQAEQSRLAEAEERRERERTTWGPEWNDWRPPAGAIGPWPEFMWPVEGWSPVRSPDGWWLTPLAEERTETAAAKEARGRRRRPREAPVIPPAATSGPHRGETQMTTAAFAAHCGVAPGTVRNWVYKGLVAAEKRGAERQSRVRIWSGERERLQARIGTRRRATSISLDAGPRSAVILGDPFAKGDDEHGDDRRVH